jgi:hypothetical protein
MRKTVIIKKPEGQPPSGFLGKPDNPVGYFAAGNDE